MPPTRRFRFALGLALTVAVTMAGCKEEKSATGGQRLELWTMQLKPTFNDFIGGLLKDWEAQHPGTTVSWTDLPANEIENKTLAAAASGHAPDLVNLNPAFANKLATAKALKALTLEPSFKDQYFQAAWDANTVGGEVVGIPWYLSTSVSFYNTDLWQQAGLKVGSWPQTYAELGADARTIKAKTKALGFMPNFGDRGKFMEILAQEGVPLLTEDGRHAAFNTPQGVAVLEFWTQLFKDGIIPKESITQGHREAIDRFQTGQTAVFPAGPQFLTMIKENSPQLYGKLAVGPQISGASGLVGVGVMNLVIPKSSTQADLALDLAKFLTSGPNQLAFCKQVPILPSIKSAAADPFFKAGEKADLESQARAIAAEQLQRAKLLVPPMPKQSELAKRLDEALSRAALGQQTPQQALEQAANEWNSLLGG